MTYRKYVETGLAAVKKRLGQSAVCFRLSCVPYNLTSELTHFLFLHLALSMAYRHGIYTPCHPLCFSTQARQLEQGPVHDLPQDGEAQDIAVDRGRHPGAAGPIPGKGLKIGDVV
jgi:hypothetical protein